MAITYLSGERIQGSSNSDSLGSAGDATSNGSDLVTSGHKLGTGCLNFDGSSDYIVASSALLNAMNTAGSISLWFNADVDEDVLLMAFCDADANTKLEIAHTAARTTSCFLRVGGTTKWAVNSTNTYNAATNWNHIVITHNGTLAEIYINGSLASMNRSNTTDNTVWWTAMRSSGADGIAIGSKAPLNGGTWNEHFDGKIDDIGIWDRALTSDEVGDLYGDGTTTMAKATTIPSGLKVYYSCDSATVTNELADYSDLAENTLFEETDTYKTYWLSDSTWIPTGMPVSASAFSNLTAWYDASDSSTVTKDGSNLVSQLNDKSGNGYNLTASGTGDAGQPLWVSDGKNGLDIINFASNKVMKAQWASKSQPTTWCAVVYTPLADNGQDNFWDNYDNTNSSMGFVNADNGDALTMFAPSGISHSSSGYTQTWTFFVNTYDNTNSSLRVNGVEKATGTVGTNPSYGLTLSTHRTGTTYGNIKLAELLVFDEALSASDITKVNNYFAAKWGITIGS